MSVRMHRLIVFSYFAVVTWQIACPHTHTHTHMHTHARTYTHTHTLTKQRAHICVPKMESRSSVFTGRDQLVSLRHGLHLISTCIQPDEAHQVDAQCDIGDYMHHAAFLTSTSIYRGLSSVARAPHQQAVGSLQDYLVLIQHVLLDHKHNVPTETGREVTVDI
jgi:hypothetical protein